MSDFDPMASWDAYTRARVDKMHEDMEGADEFNRAILGWSLVTIGVLLGFFILWMAYP